MGSPHRLAGGRSVLPLSPGPRLRPRGRMGMGCADAYGASIVWLVLSCRGETRASRARDPAHRRLGPRRGLALVWARNTSAHPAFLSDRNRAGPVFRRCCRIPARLRLGCRLRHRCDGLSAASVRGSQAASDVHRVLQNRRIHPDTGAQ